MADMQIFLFSDVFVSNSIKQIYFEQNISTEHAMITDDFGNECKQIFGWALCK